MPARSGAICCSKTCRAWARRRWRRRSRRRSAGGSPACSVPRTCCPATSPGSRSSTRRPASSSSSPARCSPTCCWPTRSTAPRPRTQSALLEAMAERQATVDNVRHALAPTFFVIATQNPVEHHGTYPLPEAQLDRFAMKLSVGYPRPGRRTRPPRGGCRRRGRRGRPRGGPGRGANSRRCRAGWRRSPCSRTCGRTWSIWAGQPRVPSEGNSGAESARAADLAARRPGVGVLEGPPVRHPRRRARSRRPRPRRPARPRPGRRR